MTSGSHLVLLRANKSQMLPDGDFTVCLGGLPKHFTTLIVDFFFFFGCCS